MLDLLAVISISPKVVGSKAKVFISGATYTLCKVLLHERCMPECQTLLICFWFIVFSLPFTLLLHLALH